MQVTVTDSLSRRAFVGVGAATGAALGLAGLTRAQAQTIVASADIAWESEADVIFVGAGTAGLYGAARTAEEGAQVLVLEKMSEEMAGGDLRCYGGRFSPNPAERLISSTMGLMPVDTAEEIAAISDQITEWFDANTDIEWIPDTTVAKGAGPEVYRALHAFFQTPQAEGIQILYGTRAKKLICNPEGRVVGVQAGLDGDEKNYKARHGVVLATGGFEANQEMVANFYSTGIQTVTVGNLSNTGDGIMMGLNAGAGLTTMGSGMEWFEFAFAVPSREFGCGIPNRHWSAAKGFGGGNIEDVPSKIFVNMHGNRFTDESLMLTHNKRFDLPMLQFGETGSFVEGNKTFYNLPMFMVCDDDCINGGPLGKVPDDNNWNYYRAYDIYDWSDDNQAEIERGWILKADTIEELAAQMSAVDYITGEVKAVDPDALRATIDAWNDACEKGEDPLGRPAESLRPIVTPPFYAAEMMPCTLFTFGGLKTDFAGEVLDWDGVAIPGLYAAGNTCCDGGFMFGAMYAFARGQVAGSNAYRFDAWE